MSILLCVSISITRKKERMMPLSEQLNNMNKEVKIKVYDCI